MKRGDIIEIQTFAMSLLFRAPSEKVINRTWEEYEEIRSRIEADANSKILGLGAFGCPLRLANVHIDTRLPDREMDLGRNGNVQVRPPNTVLGYAIRVECA